MECPELRLEDPERSVAGSLGHDSGRGGCPLEVAATVTDAHLRQFGALIGEAPTREALAASGGAWALGSGEASLFGVSQTVNCRWERIVQVHISCGTRFRAKCRYSFRAGSTCIGHSAGALFPSAQVKTCRIGICQALCISFVGFRLAL